MNLPIVNIAGYKFVALDQLETRRQALLSRCRELELKGTILLSEEGINLFLAGLQDAVDGIVAFLRDDPKLADFEVKSSPGDHQPYSRMLVKIKDEIIAFGVEGIAPAEYTSPRITPRELKQWLDEKRPVRLLDTRNDYELEVGTFSGAIDMQLDDFRNFPAAVDKLPESLKDEVVVTFCTGGIRCEKAAPYLERQGFKNVLQLDGGILKYFEECGEAHYDGECFVFDKRVAVDGSLQETETSYCFVCQATLTANDRKSPKYEFGKSCPYCWTRPEERRAQRVQQRNVAIRKFVTPLPGSTPYENQRPLHVPERLDNLTALEFLLGIRTRLSRSDWEREMSLGRIQINGQPITADFRVRTGHTVKHVIPAEVEPDVNGDIQVLFEDEAIVVVDKPAPLPVHPSGRFNRNTLTYILDQVYFRQRLRVAHRLDANTSGVMLLSKSRAVAAQLQPRFEAGEVTKRYWARIHGHPADDTFHCDAPISASPTKLGARVPCDDGLPACSRFVVLQRFPDGTSLVEANPVTGRTNQIRVHLWHLHLPIVGDPLYLPEQQLGQQQTLDLTAAPLCLHARSLAFPHPETGDEVEFVSERVTWHAPASTR